VFNTLSQVAVTDTGFWIICQKQGADYIGKTAMAVASDQNVRSIGSTNVDIQSVYFGSGANCATVCSTSPCNICNQVGSKITTVSRSSTGSYNINGIDGTKYNCTSTAYGTIPTFLFHDRNSSTSLLAKVNALNTSNAFSDTSLASVTCIGIP
jgi:hypothetical protein